MTHRTTEWRWPWYQQVTDALAFLLGMGIAITMTYRDSYPWLGVVLVGACIGKLTTSQLLRLLLGRWEDKP
jgi:uncharacterized membrane protein